PVRDLVFLSSVACGPCRRDVGNVADLSGELAGHRVDAVSQVLPNAGDAAHVGLAAELSFRTDFEGDAGYFRSEGVELIHHGVDGVLELRDLAADFHGDLLAQVAIGHGRGDFRDVADLGGQVA